LILPEGCERLWSWYAIGSAGIISCTAQTLLRLPGFVSEYLEVLLRQSHA